MQRTQEEMIDQNNGRMRPLQREIYRRKTWFVCSSFKKKKLILICETYENLSYIIIMQVFDACDESEI